MLPLIRLQSGAKEICCKPKPKFRLQTGNLRRQSRLIPSFLLSSNSGRKVSTLGFLYYRARRMMEAWKQRHGII
eukprot:UN00012